MQLRVLKNDGSTEDFLPTKVMNTIANGLGESGSLSAGLTEDLSAAIVAYVMKRYGYATVTSQEIAAMIKAVLCDTGFQEAALTIQQHTTERQLKRNRIEIINCKDVLTSPTQEINRSTRLNQQLPSSPWNKTRIVNDLTEHHAAPRLLARIVAGLVEEKVLKLESRRIFSSVIKGLMLNELWNIRTAELALMETQKDNLKKQTSERKPTRVNKKSGSKLPEPPRRKIALKPAAVLAIGNN